MSGLLRRQLLGLYRNRDVAEKQRIKDRLLEFQMGPWAWILDRPVELLYGRNLRALATFYRTDKWNRHWYAQHYETIFQRIRRKPINLLEIGVGGEDNPRKGGNSLRMWRTYFPHARIFGLDIYDKTPHQSGRIKIFRGSQADPQFLDSVVREIGNIDVIIDDGSHVNEHMIFTFNHLFPHLADGGIYAVEDTQTSYWKEFGGNETDRNDPATAMAYFRSLVYGLNWTEFRGGYEPNYFDLNVKSIAFFHNLVIIQKGMNREREFAAD